MKRMKKAETLGLLVLFVGLSLPLSVAFGIDPGLLDGQWFRAKGSMKGYAIDMEHNVVVGPVSGGTTFYMMIFLNDGAFQITTCAPDDDNPGIWHSSTSGPIPFERIYGANFELWDFQGTPIPIYQGSSNWRVYPSLYLKVTTDGPNLKKATLKTISCGIWGDMEEGNVLGSCKLSGSSITADKVPPDCTDH